MADTFTPDESLIVLLNELVDQATVKHTDSQSDETFTECRLCGEWEGHTDLCPMPAIERYLMTPSVPDEHDHVCEHDHVWRLNKHGRICALCLKIEEGKSPYAP